MTVTRIFYYRPAYFETYFENYEPIHDVDKLFSCSPIYINLEAIIDDREYEYDIRYMNDDRRLACTGCALKYMDYKEGEDPDQICKEKTEFMYEIARIIIPGALMAVLRNNEES